MVKRTFCILLSILIFIYSPIYAAAFSSFNALQLENCSRIYVDSNSYGGFVYGFRGKTLYSSMLVPSHYNRYVNVSYNINSVCQSGELSCAMYICDNKTSKYCITGINMNSGAVVDYTFVGVNDASSKMFSLSGSYAYFMRSDATYSYIAVYGLDGKYKKKCSFNDNVYLLFNNNSITYAMLYDGRIYRFSGTGYTLVANIGRGVNASNAGIGYICTESGMLVSLENGNTSSVSADSQNCIVSANGGVYRADGFRLNFTKNNVSERSIELSSKIRCIVTHNNRIAALDYAYDYNDISDSELKSYEIRNNSSSIYNNSGVNQSGNDEFPNEYRVEKGKYLIGVTPSTSVSAFKKKFSKSILIYDSNGNTVSSGMIKTGYTVSIGNNSYTIIISGDVSGEGNVKSNDTNVLMNYLAGAVELSEIQLESADYDLNGIVDNRDLVYIARNSS